MNGWMGSCVCIMFWLCAFIIGHAGLLLLGRKVIQQELGPAVYRPGRPKHPTDAAHGRGKQHLATFMSL